MPSKTYLKSVVDDKEQKIKSLAFQNKQLEKRITDLLLMNKNLRIEIDLLNLPKEEKKWYQCWKFKFWKR